MKIDFGKLIYRAFMIFVVLYLLAGLVFFFYKFQPIRIDSVSIDRVVVQRGGEICFDISGEKLLRFPADIQVDIVNDIEIRLFNYSSNANVGKLPHKPQCSYVPNRTELGENRIRFRFTHWLLGIRPIVTEAFSAPFTVTMGEVTRGPKGDTGRPGKNFWGK